MQQNFHFLDPFTYMSVEENVSPVFTQEFHMMSLVCVCWGGGVRGCSLTLEDVVLR